MLCSSSLTWNQPPWCLEAPREAREDCSDVEMRLARPPLQCEALVSFLTLLAARCAFFARCDDVVCVDDFRVGVSLWLDVKFDNGGLTIYSVI